MVKSYAKKYDLSKDKPDAPYKGTQGYAFEGANSLEERAKQYQRWKAYGSKVRPEEEKNGPLDQLGSVSSSWLETLGYDTIEGEALATFKDHKGGIVPGVFHYPMSYQMFLEWLNSPSKGKWLHAHPSFMQNPAHTEGNDGSFEARLGGRSTTRREEFMDGTTAKAVKRAKAILQKSKWG